MAGRERMRLTDRAVARFRPREREYTVWDNHVAGLGVRVRPTGGRSYVLLEDAGGRSRRVSLGPVSLKTVAEARRECHAHKAEPEATGAPRRVAPLFRDFVEGAWKDAHFEGYKPSTRKGVRSVLDRQLVPAFGSKPLDRITPAHIGRWFDRFSRTAPGNANHALDLLTQIVNFAIERGHLDTNPARAVERNPRRVLTRFLSREEIARLHRVLDRQTRQSRCEQADITGLVPARRQSYPGTDIPRSPEPPGIVDRRHERQRHDRAHAGHGHQEAAYRVFAGQLTDQLLQPCQLAAQSLTRTKDRLGRRFQHRVACDQLPDTGLVAALRDLAQLQAEVAEHAAQRELHVDERVLHGLARAQQRPLLLRRHRLAVHRPEPAHLQKPGDAFGVPAIRLDRHRLQRRLHLACLHQHGLEAGVGQPLVQPLRQRTGFEPDRCDPVRQLAHGHMVVVGRRGDLQHLADRLDPVRLAVIVDERDHGLNRRSSSAWAK